MQNTVGMVSLGCAKNRVDAELMLCTLRNAGYKIVEEAAMADVAIINTCGFIEDAKRQSVETILELADAKTEGQRLVITGCLSQRYAGDLSKDIPEADLILGVNDYKKLPQRTKKQKRYFKKAEQKARKLQIRRVDMLLDSLKTGKPVRQWA